MIFDVLFWSGLILFLGYFFQYLFKKILIPDIIMLIALGVLLGPSVFGIVNVSSFGYAVNIFIVFALIFLVFDGSFNINFRSLASQMRPALIISSLCYFLSVLIVTAVSYFVFRNILVSLLLGFALGGVSSGFVIPLLKNVDSFPSSVYTSLVLEGAITDVLTVVFSFMVINVATQSAINFRNAISSLIVLFAIGIFMGFFGALLWIFIVHNVFKSKNNFILTIAFLLILYSITEFIGGNGVLASLFFGMTLRNAKRIFVAGSALVDKSFRDDYFVLSSQERYIYDQISFLIKSFFYVYIGLIFEFNAFYLVIGGVVSFLFYLSRRFVTQFMNNDRLISSVFGRGIAAAAVAKIALIDKVISTSVLSFINSVIVISIFLSSITFFVAMVIFKKEHIKKAMSEKTNAVNA